MDQFLLALRRRGLLLNSLLRKQWSLLTVLILLDEQRRVLLLDFQRSWFLDRLGWSLDHQRLDRTTFIKLLHLIVLLVDQLIAVLVPFRQLLFDWLLRRLHQRLALIVPQLLFEFFNSFRIEPQSPQDLLRLRPALVVVVARRTADALVETELAAAVGTILERKDVYQMLVLAFVAKHARACDVEKTNILWHDILQYQSLLSRRDIVLLK